MNNVDPIYVHMNCVKVKVLTMRYHLANSHMDKSRSKSCPVCSVDEESLQHFLFDCNKMACLNTITQLQTVLSKYGFIYPAFCLESYDWYIRLLLDPSWYVGDDALLNELNYISTKYIFSRHNSRSIATGFSSRYVNARRYKGAKYVSD